MQYSKNKKLVGVCHYWLHNQIYLQKKKAISIFVKDESVLYVILSSTLQFEKK